MSTVKEKKLNRLSEMYTRPHFFNFTELTVKRKKE